MNEKYAPFIPQNEMQHHGDHYGHTKNHSCKLEKCFIILKRNNCQSKQAI